MRISIKRTFGVTAGVCKTVVKADEEAKAQKAVAARNREQNKLRMRQMGEAQWTAKESDGISLLTG